jgi:hypothetical protein
MPDYIEFMLLRPHMVLFLIKLHWMQISLVFLPNSRSRGACSQQYGEIHIGP